MEGPMGPMPTSLADLPAEYVNYDVGPAVITTSIVMTVATLVLVAVRFTIRSNSALGLGIDDWFILAVVPLMVGFMAATLLAVRQGGAGRHLIVNMLLGMERIEALNLYLYIGEYLYFTMVAVIKASILAMYYRIFPTRSMKWGVYILGATVALWWIAIILVTIFQCQPVHKAYKPFMPTGICLPKEQFFLATRSPTSYKMPSFSRFLRENVLIIGCIRLKSLLDLVHSDDFSACLPTLRPLLGFLFSRAFSTVRSSGRTPDNQGNLHRRTIITIGGGRAKVGAGFSKQSTKNSNGLKSFTQLDEGDSFDDGPRLLPKGYKATREVSALGPKGRDPSFCSDEILLDGIKVKRDVVYLSEDKGRQLMELS
ncbi:hypothetical protein V8F33_007834 [Rhypophila sp. PSN 637]